MQCIHGTKTLKRTDILSNFSLEHRETQYLAIGFWDRPTGLVPTFPLSSYERQIRSRSADVMSKRLFCAEMRLSKMFSVLLAVTQHEE